MKSENTHVKVVVFINKRIKKKIMKGRKINKKIKVITKFD